jgi:hypothetical protein
MVLHQSSISKIHAHARFKKLSLLFGCPLCHNRCVPKAVPDSARISRMRPLSIICRTYVKAIADVRLDETGRISSR